MNRYVSVMFTSLLLCTSLALADAKVLGKKEVRLESPNEVRLWLAGLGDGPVLASCSKRIYENKTISAGVVTGAIIQKIHGVETKTKTPAMMFGDLSSCWTTYDLEIQIGESPDDVNNVRVQCEAFLACP